MRNPVKLRPPTTRAKLYLIEDQGGFWDYEAGKVPVPSELQPAKGIFLGGCVSTGVGSIEDDVDVMAHAHVVSSCPHVGWICFQLPVYFYSPRFKWMRMHELAHIISRRGHDERWRKVMRALGQPIPEHLRYRPRGPLWAV